MAKHYKNTNRKSPRFGQHYTLGAGGSHVYVRNGKRTVIGGKKPAPFDPTAPLTGKAFDQQVESAVNLKYKPQLNALASQGRQLDQQRVNTDKAWQDYLAMTGRNNATNAAAYQGAANQIYGQAQQAATADEARRQQLAAQMPGANVGVQQPSAVEATAQQAAAARAASARTQGNLITSQGATQAAFGADQSRIGAGIRALELGKVDTAKRQVGQQTVDLLGQEGDYRNQQRQALTQSEREWKTAQQTFGLNVANTQADNALAAAKAAADEADKKANRKLKSQSQAETKRHNTTTEGIAQQRVDKTGSGSGGGFTGTQIRKTKAKVRTAKTSAGAYLSNGDWVVARKGKSPLKGEQARVAVKRALTAKFGDSLIAQVAMEYAKYGGVVTPGLRAKFKRAYGTTPKLGRTGLGKGVLNRKVRAG